MKILKLIAVLIITVALAFLVSAALDIPWVAAEVVRQIIIYVVVLVLALIGYWVFKEILNAE